MEETSFLIRDKICVIFILFEFMSSLLEKQAFSQRLQLALAQANYNQGPTALAKEFNLRYSGAPVSVQSANNWLQGKAIPSQDKLAVLSLWLDVSNQWLRFGDHDSEVSLPQDITQSEDYIYYLKFRSLTHNQKSIIRSLIDEFKP